MTSRRSRLLIVTTVPETLATILRGQPAHLSEHFDVSLVTSPDDGLEQVARSEGVKVAAVAMKRGISPLNDALAVIRMIRQISTIKPDIIHSYTPKAGLVAMLAGWLCRVPVRIHTFTGLIFPSRSGLMQQILIWIDRLISACATRVVPEGEGVKRDLITYRITGKPLTVVGHGNIAGVDTGHYSRGASFNALPEVADSSAAAFVFCFIGRLNRDKGVAELARAFERLPEHARLLLVGGLDETAPVDEQTLDILKRHPRIEMLGFQADVRPALAHSHVLVLPSYREGFPNVLLQAGAMELPAIATDINGCNEVIEPGYNGWLVPPRDVGALAAAMTTAMQAEPDQLRQMGSVARRRVIERFQQKDHWKRMVALYQAEMKREQLRQVP